MTVMLVADRSITKSTSSCFVTAKA